VIVPSLWWLFRLTLEGRLSESFRPIELGGEEKR
jgi:hypothetical protein